MYFFSSNGTSCHIYNDDFPFCCHIMEQNHWEKHSNRNGLELEEKQTKLPVCSGFVAPALSMKGRTRLVTVFVVLVFVLPSLAPINYKTNRKQGLGTTDKAQHITSTATTRGVEAGHWG